MSNLINIKDRQIQAIVAAVLTALEQQGVAEIVFVPEDQAKVVRSAIRKAIKAQWGYKVNTYYGHSHIVVDCKEAYDAAPTAAKEAMDNQLRKAMGGRDYGSGVDTSAPVDDGGWRLDWRRFA